MINSICLEYIGHLEYMLSYCRKLYTELCTHTSELFMLGCLTDSDCRHVKGIHLNFYPSFNSRSSLARAFLSGAFPRLFGWLLKDNERKVLNHSIFDALKKLVGGMGYFLLQSTKPHTPAYALNDSPAGLAAYIGEKFSGWSDGGDGKGVSFDDLLTNVSIYWFTQTIGSSMRFYKENVSRQARKASR